MLPLLHVVGNCRTKWWVCFVVVCCCGAGIERSALQWVLTAFAWCSGCHLPFLTAGGGSLHKQATKCDNSCDKQQNDCTLDVSLKAMSSLHHVLHGATVLCVANNGRGVLYTRMIQPTL